MTTLPIEEKRIRVLLSLYQLHTTVSPHVDVEDLEKLADVGGDYYEILRYLGAPGKGWLKKSNMVVRLTSEGIDKAEEIIKMQMAEKMQLVLKKIYDMAGSVHTSEVNYFALQQELGMNIRELTPILNDFDNRGWMGNCSDEAVCLSSAGVLAVENSRLESRDGGDIYQTNIHGNNYGGIQQGTHGSTQTITLTHTSNPDFDKALASIAELIRTSSIADDEKEELQGEVQSINKLALKELNQANLERAKLKLDYLKTSLTAADLVVKAAPYLAALYHFFQHLPR
jgi:uncharacterized protein YqfB (UPF0267 family)